MMGELSVREFFGLLGGVLVLAGVVAVVARGGQVAQILDSGGKAFTGMVKAATLQG